MKNGNPQPYKDRRKPVLSFLRSQPLQVSPLSLGHSKCTGRSKHSTYDSIHPRVLRTKIVVKVKKERSCQEMKARSLRALLLASSLILSVGTTAMPIMAVDIAPDTSDSGISIDADDGKFRCWKIYLCTIPSPLNPLCPTPIGDFNLFVPVQIILKK